MKIAIDTMGGDNAPLSNIEGAFQYFKENENSSTEIIFVGNENDITPLLSKFSEFSSKISVLHAPDVVNMDESPAKIHRTKPDSSMVKSVELLKDGRVDAVISAGNTGALLSSSLFLVGTIPGIRRPALAPFIPTNNGGFILCDAGANVDCRYIHLVHFGIMASAYMEAFLGKKNPTVGLLNVGSEEKKGNELTRTTFPFMQEHVNNFVGNIEARYILDGKVDIVVCDGFIGNTVLKFIEGVISHMMTWLKESINDHPISRLSFPLMAPAFKDMKKLLDYEEYGGTPFLGINGIVIKAHGSSTSKSIKNSIISAQKICERELIKNIGERISAHLDLMDDFQNEQKS
ncbi:MAG: phosphate acyltransferase PlsX [Candidatus Marinimicrobia bacterium]|nr:phosphate acyltransferase PlsX [Candidatus Neomarinimicrobiota bacterium]